MAWALPEDPAGRLALALGYPYAIPAGSFLYRDGAAMPLERLETAGRVPVLAIGSNRSPEQLARKYAGWPKGTEIPVTAARLAGHDVVHAAHFARYGSLPAVLCPAPGTRVEVAVTWLTETQLERMHETEGARNYRYGEPDRLDLRLGDGAPLDHAVLVYRGRHGALAPDGAPLPLAAVPAEGRARPGVRQAEALARARDLLAPKRALEDFLLELIDDAAVREAHVRRLARWAIGRDDPGSVESVSARRDIGTGARSRPASLSMTASGGRGEGAGDAS